MTIQRLMAQLPAARDAEWLKQALQAAVELELATIPPYLCAMWSIKDLGHPAYDAIREIVMEEMLHMGLACNLLTTVGGEPRIVDRAPTYPGPLPGGVRPNVRLALCGLTKDVVKNVFMEVEHPDHSPLAAVLGETFPTIGAFYAAILAAFEKLPPDAVAGARQLVSSGVGLFKILSMNDVRRAVGLICEQGEGTAQSPYSPTFAPDDLAHYYRFAEIYHERRLVQTPAGAYKYEGAPLPFPEVYPMAEAPAGGYAESQEFNAAYTDVLNGLQRAWATGAQAHLGAAIGAMFALADLAIALMQQPLPAGGGNFGPTFQTTSGAVPPAAHASARVAASARGAEGPPELPAEIVTMQAQRLHRMHHFLWHEVRNGWLFYDDAVRSALRMLGWEPPRPALRPTATGRAPILDNDSGEDFLYMHRQMIAMVNERLAAIGSPGYPRVEGWSSLPLPGDADYPVPPAWATGDASLDAYLAETKSDAFFTQTMQPWEQSFRDPQWLLARSLGEMGARLEFTIHNRMHMRWCSNPGAMRPDVDPATPDNIDPAWDNPAYNWLGDTYSSHVYPWFWKIHGWVDDRIEDWKNAHGVAGEIPWRGTWVGKMPHHHPHGALGAVLSGDAAARQAHDADLRAALRIILRSGVRCHFYDPVEIPPEAPLARGR